MSHAAGLTFNILILAGLGVTIFYCFRLSRQFERMRADRKAFELLIQSLNTAADRAGASIAAFREMAGGNGDILQERINKSRAMADELEIMIQAGDSLAGRLEKLAEDSGRAAAEKSGGAAGADEETPEARPQKTPAAEPKKNPAAEPRTRAEKELLEAVKAKQQS
ncbi:MAG: hypothetical protein KGL10_08485 [Alphaproteobacteria bacterium]|nr:hypothetical protein [Alphaproteobacteria bacterium]